MWEVGSGLAVSMTAFMALVSASLIGRALATPWPNAIHFWVPAQFVMIALFFVFGVIVTLSIEKGSPQYPRVVLAIGIIGAVCEFVLAVFGMPMVSIS